MKKSKGKRTEKPPKGATKGPPCSDDPGKDDGMVPCPYCRKKFEPLSMHQFKCQSKPSDEQIVENTPRGMSCSEAGDGVGHLSTEYEEVQDFEDYGFYNSSSDDEDYSEIMEILSGVKKRIKSSKNGGGSYKSNEGKSHPLKTYDEKAFKEATKDLKWIDSPYSSDDEYERKDEYPSDDTGEDSDLYYDEAANPDDKNKPDSKNEKNRAIIGEEETEYCLEKIDALMSKLLQKLNDRTKLLWVKMNSGSHYSNVKLPNEMEFDYMLCPTQVQCRIEPSSQHPCYCRVFVTNKQELPLEFQEILGPQDELTPSKFKGYVFGILDQIRPRNKLLSRVENKSLCPAYTVDYKIGRTRLNESISIDWVPCLEVQDPPECNREWKTRLLTEEEKKSCPLYVVAKNFDDDGAQLELWRLSFSTFEVKILRDKCNEEDRNIVKVLKHIMKLETEKFNKANDTMKMCSYHIMSQCLRYFEETTQRPTGKSYLLDMIDHLIIAVHSKDIRHFFIPSFNLLRDVTYKECQNFKLNLYYYRKEFKKYKPGRQVTPIIRMCGDLGLINVERAKSRL